MKRARLLWAVGMTTMSLLLMAGYTAAGVVNTTETMEQAAPMAPVIVEESAPLPQTPAEALNVTVRAEELDQGTKLTVTDADGKAVVMRAMGAQQDTVLPLMPGIYSVTAETGVSATFCVEKNAAITNVSGNGWTDGEVLHLTTEPRCTLLVVQSTAQLGEAEFLTYNLVGQDYEQQRSVGYIEGEDRGKAVFAGLLPGTYTLTTPDGITRDITLSEQMPAVTIGLD